MASMRSVGWPAPTGTLPVAAKRAGIISIALWLAVAAPGRARSLRISARR
jgi:hypothetical protein